MGRVYELAKCKGGTQGCSTTAAAAYILKVLQRVLAHVVLPASDVPLCQRSLVEDPMHLHPGHHLLVRVAPGGCVHEEAPCRGVFPVEWGLAGGV